MKVPKIVLFLLFLVVLLNSFAFLGYAAEAEYSGVCGDAVSWTLDIETKTLTVSGNGEMDDYDSYDTAPYIKDHLRDIEKVIIDNGVTRIGNRAFYCSNITEVVIPNTVKEIGDEAFEGCADLKSVSNMPRVTQIGKRAFYGCASLRDIVLPVALWSLGEQSFALSGIIEIELPVGVQSIGKEAFAGCKGLEKITVVDDFSEKYISSGNCIIDITTKKLVAGCKTSVIPTDKDVRYIESRAFSGSLGLESVYIPKSVAVIEKEAFYNCDELREVTMTPSVEDISPRAFYGCDSLEALKIVGTHGRYITKNNCIIEKASKKLVVGCKASVIPDDGSVTMIGDEAFVGCSGLTEIEIPSSVTEVGRKAFAECTGLTEMKLSVRRTDGLFYGCTSLKNIYFKDKVEEIGSGTFSNCISLEKIVICCSKDELKKMTIASDYAEGASGFEIRRHEGSFVQINYQMHAVHCKLCGSAEELEAHYSDYWKYIDDTKHKGICDCGITLEETHSWEVKDTVPATKKVQGMKKYSCSICDAEKFEIIPRLRGCESAILPEVYVVLTSLCAAYGYKKVRNKRK